ncbi:ionotropic receptor 93a-like [Oratosquilla oratoria]|uniref:ionotropic receptor 93a-like n=1 Tax=Oratosquilla oratoria TaxID=337810 RepID=UPI003F771C91
MLLVIGKDMANALRIPASEPSKELLMRGKDVLGHLIRSTLLDLDEPNLCSALVYTDGKTSPAAMKKFLEVTSIFRGTTVMELELPMHTKNTSLPNLSDIIRKGRKVRLSAWCLIVLVMSEDTYFLEWLAKAIEKGRFLLWTNRMVVLSRIQRTELLRLLSGPWTYSMMSTVFVNHVYVVAFCRWSVYTHLPYTLEGSQTVHLASWKPKRGLVKLSPFPVFGPKFNSFHGATINVTALPFSPYWDEETEDGVVKARSGTDYYMLDSIARSLNFEIYVIPTQNWEQVEKVVERVSFLAPVFHIVLPRRAEKYDFSFTYEFSSFTFAMAKPGLKPQWQSLYYPLANQVWASIFATVLFMPLPLYINLQRNLPSRTSYRTALGFWLVFAYIVGIAYRGNLTASLTRPTYPPRAENIFQLVQADASVGMPPYGAHFRQFYLESESPVFRKIGENFVIVPTVKDGLQRCLQENFAFMDSRRYVELQIARDFTQPDGSIDHYIAKDDAFPGLSAWPFPHDAPYKHAFDSKIMSIVEAGLYEKWSKDMLAEARRQGRRLASRNREGTQGSSKTGGVALTLTHMQGPLFLLLLGWALVFIVFFIELGISRIQQS